MRLPTLASLRRVRYATTVVRKKGRVVLRPRSCLRASASNAEDETKVCWASVFLSSSYLAADNESDMSDTIQQ